MDVRKISVALDTPDLMYFMTSQWNLKSTFLFSKTHEQTPFRMTKADCCSTKKVP